MEEKQRWECWANSWLFPHVCFSHSQLNMKSFKSNVCIGIVLLWAHRDTRSHFVYLGMQKYLGPGQYIRLSGNDLLCSEKCLTVLVKAQSSDYRILTVFNSSDEIVVFPPLLITIITNLEGGWERPKRQ